MATENKDNSTLGVAPETAGNSLPNALDFMIRQIIKGLVNTSLPVIVMKCYPGGTGGAAGYVDIKPLVCQTDASGEILPPAVIYHIPYFRLQAGVAAVVIDPIPGDIGLAVFSQADASALLQGATQPVQPGSWRCYNQADAFYIGGFLNKQPSVWIELTQGGVININASGGVNITAPNVNITGDMTSGGISYLGHVHGCPHGGTTSTPQ